MSGAELPRRKRMRLPNYDYGTAGYYFVTVCTQDNRCVLGTGVGAGLARPELSPVGQMVREEAARLPERFPHVAVDKYVIMPNHVHAILRLSASPAPTASLPEILGAFKSLTTRRWNQVRGVMGERLWQRSYYDHVIGNQEDYLRIWQYIEENPAKGREDTYYQPW